jgi:hypothetical protein
MILISFSAIYSASVQASKAKDSNCVDRIKAPSCAAFLVGCNSSFTKDMEVETRSRCYQSMLKSFKNSTDGTCKACWCIQAISTLESIETIVSDELIVKPEYRTMCSESVEEFIVLQSLMRLSVAFITLVNILLKVGAMSTCVTNWPYILLRLLCSFCVFYYYYNFSLVWSVPARPARKTPHAHRSRPLSRPKSFCDAIHEHGHCGDACQYQNTGVCREIRSGISRFHGRLQRFFIGLVRRAGKSFS